MKYIFRKIVLIAITIVMIFLVIKWDLIYYGLQQAKGQLSIMYNAQKLDSFLEDPVYPDSLKQKISLVKKVKLFASKELGFDSEDQYEKMFDQQGKELMWVVTAALPYQLESYEWKFPILGKVEYKGFFVKTEAEKLQKELKTKGFDVRLRTASAWSTLGWLNDPLLSNVLLYSPGRLAELIFHELTHDEIFIKDSVDFNENLASFFGQEFTKLFFEKQSKKYKKNYEKYLDQLDDRIQLNQFVSGYLPRFDSLYESIRNLSITEKENQKYYFTERFRQDLRNQSFHNKKYSEFLNSGIEVNNAFLLSYRRYSGFYNLLKNELQDKFGGDILQMFSSYQEKSKSF